MRLDNLYHWVPIYYMRLLGDRPLYMDTTSGTMQLAGRDPVGYSERYSSHAPTSTASDQEPVYPVMERLMYLPSVNTIFGITTRSGSMDITPVVGPDFASGQIRCESLCLAVYPPNRPGPWAGPWVYLHFERQHGKSGMAINGQTLSRLSSVAQLQKYVARTCIGAALRRHVLMASVVDYLRLKANETRFAPDAEGGRKAVKRLKTGYGSMDAVDAARDDFY